MKEGEGDCDTDHECEGDLVCGTNNCAWGGGDDCCRQPQVRTERRGRWTIGLLITMITLVTSNYTKTIIVAPTV